jgi:hypothetical protein
MTHLEYAFYGVHHARRSVKVSHLLDAARYAEEATGISGRPHPTYAWQAWGNALEDVALYIREDVDANYVGAIDKFKIGYRERSDLDPDVGLSTLVALGRCRYRRAGEEDFANKPAELTTAARDLTDAIEEAERLLAGDQLDMRHSLIAQAQAEAHLWISQVCVQLTKLGQIPPADPAGHCQRAAEVARQYNDPNWARYQLEWARLAGESAAARERAQEILAAEETVPAAVLRDAILFVASRISDLVPRLGFLRTHWNRFSQDGHLESRCRMRLVLTSCELRLNDPRWDEDSKKKCEEDLELAQEIWQGLRDRKAVEAVELRVAHLDHRGRYWWKIYDDRSADSGSPDQLRTACRYFTMAIQAADGLLEEADRQQLDRLRTTGESSAPLDQVCLAQRQLFGQMSLAEREQIHRCLSATLNTRTVLADAILGLLRRHGRDLSIDERRELVATGIGALRMIPLVDPAYLDDVRQLSDQLNAEAARAAQRTRSRRVSARRG